MPSRLWTALTEPRPEVVRPDERRQARLLASLLVLVSLVGLVSGLVQWALVPHFGATLLDITGGVAVILVAWRLARGPRFRIAAALTIAVVSAACFAASLANRADHWALAFPVLGVALACLFFSPGWGAAVAVVNVAGILSLSSVLPLGTVLGAAMLNLVCSAMTVVAIRHRQLLEIDRRAEMESKERQLRAAERMALLGRLAASVAHDLATPLTFVAANLDLIARETRRADPPDALVRALDDARHGADRMGAIVADLRAFSRFDDALVGPVDVRQVLDSALRISGSELQARARVETHFAEVPPVHAAASQLAQVFMNLLVNAAQAIPEGEAERHCIEVAVASGTDATVEVAVRDTGRGITPEVAARIFEPFFTTKPAGTGLGLAICRDIVTKLGGRIDVVSRVGDGTTMRVVLPTAPGA